MGRTPDSTTGFTHFSGKKAAAVIPPPAARAAFNRSRRVMDCFVIMIILKDANNAEISFWITQIYISILTFVKRIFSGKEF
jgi:hypothetical protein